MNALCWWALLMLLHVVLAVLSLVEAWVHAGKLGAANWWCAVLPILPGATICAVFGVVVIAEAWNEQRKALWARAKKTTRQHWMTTSLHLTAALWRYQDKPTRTNGALVWALCAYICGIYRLFTWTHERSRQ